LVKVMASLVRWVAVITSAETLDRKTAMTSSCRVSFEERLQVVENLESSTLPTRVSYKLECNTLVLGRGNMLARKVKVGTLPKT